MDYYASLEDMRDMVICGRRADAAGDRPVVRIFTQQRIVRTRSPHVSPEKEEQKHHPQRRQQGHHLGPWRHSALLSPKQYKPVLDQSLHKVSATCLLQLTESEAASPSCAQARS